VVAASLCSNVPERGHAAPDEAALNDLTESNFAHDPGPLMGWTGCFPPRAVAAPQHWAVLAAIVLENLRLKSDNIHTEPRFGFMEQRCIVGVGKLRENQIQIQTCRNRIHLLRRQRGNVV
jgi:hypothetical protein